jgi:ankyrin repeat protein
MKKLFAALTLALISQLVHAQKLLEAVDASDYAQVEQLIKDGEKVNKPNKQGQFALWNAAWTHDPKMVALLIKNGADAKQLFKAKQGEIGLLEIATQEGPLEVVQLLSDAGADINLKSAHGQTPLRIASRNGHLAIVRYLLDKGANVDTRGDDGATPLEAAAGKGHADIVQLLVEKGANVNIQDKDGDSPLGEAVKGGHLQVVQFLLEKGADASMKNKEGADALELARLQGQPRIAELLRGQKKG